MSRIEVLDYDEMTPEQQALHDEILSGPRSRIGGPMNGWFRSPKLGSLYQKVGAFCRYHHRRSALESISRMAGPPTVSPQSRPRPFDRCCY